METEIIIKKNLKVKGWKKGFALNQNQMQKKKSKNICKKISRLRQINCKSPNFNIEIEMQIKKSEHKKIQETNCFLNAMTRRDLFLI